MTTLSRRSPALLAFPRIVRVFCAAFLAVLLASAAHATPVITEIMASNHTTLADDDGDYSDWIELYNPDATPVNLDGYYLTDKPNKPTKWRFPAVTLPAGGYLVVFASGKDHTDPAKTLHTSFKLSADGDYLGLIKPDGATPASEFSPGFPPQYDDISYGVTQPTNSSETPQYGYFTVATPGARNGDGSTLTLVEQVTFSRASGPFTGQPQVTLSGASAGEKIRYVIADPSATGAAVDAPTAASPLYSGPITLDHTVVIRAAVFSADDSRHSPAVSAHYLQLDETTANRLDTFTSPLPLIVLDDHGYGPLVKDDVDHPSFFYGFTPGTDGNASFTSTPTYATTSTMSVRGETSSLFPKKSFKFEMLDSTGKDTALPLFQLSSFAEWNLVGPWNYDRSFIRNSVAYALSNRIGRWAARTQLAEVFFNNNGGPLDLTDYAGVYLLTDKIEEDPNRVAITKLSASDTSGNALTGGYILQIDEPDPEKYSWKTDHGFPDMDSSVMMVESPKAAKLPQVQRDYIRNYIQDAENALYADQASGWKTHHYLDYFDRDSWVDHHLLNTFMKNTDAFWRSAYFTKDRGGKLTAGPIWDFDRSMDSTDPRDDNYDTWSATKFTSQGAAIQYWEFGWWGILAQDPDFMQAWVDRWQSLRTTEFSDQALADTVTGFADQVGADAAARDAALWPDNVSQYGDYAGETNHLKDWLVHRAQWIDRQFVAPPAAGAAGQLLRVIAPTGAKLAYTLDGTDPRLPGGAVSPAAHFADAEMLFVDPTLVRVRSYRADQAAVFPGSPWSRLVIPSTDHGSAGDGTLPDLSRTITADLGQDITLGLIGTVNGSVTYQWYLDDQAIAGETHATLALSHLGESQAGNYTLVVSSSGSELTSVAFTLKVSGSLNLANLSSRAHVGTGSDVLISGFVVDGDGTKNFLLRAVGPALANFNVGQPLAAPTLRLYKSDGTLLASNTGWETGPEPTAVAAAATQVGAFALTSGSKDSALIMHLPAGIYSLNASGVDGGTGVGLAEIYALDDASSPVNLSARARVQAGENLLIGGFVVSGQNPRRFLIRGVGPTLASYGVPDPLPDPVLQIVSGTTTLYQNDDWGTNADPASISATAQAVGAFSLAPGSADAAIVVDLPPGLYSVLVSGKNNASGVALVEIYAVR